MAILFLVIVGNLLIRPMPNTVNFNFNTLTDDGFWYAVKSLEFSGMEKQQAADKAIIWWNENREMYKPLYEKYDTSNPDAQHLDKLFGHRVLYPYVSSFLVKHFDFLGLLIFPILAYAGIWIILVFTLLKKSSIAFYLPFFLLAGSTHYSERSISTSGTDILLSLMVLIFIFSCHQLAKAKFKVWLVLNLMIILGNFTRPSTIIWFALSICVMTIYFKRVELNTKTKLIYFVSFFVNNIICYIMIEITWNYSNAVRTSEWYPKENDLVSILGRIFRTLSSDLITILTKDFSLLLIALMSLVYIIIKLEYIKHYFFKGSKIYDLICDNTHFTIFATRAVVVSLQIYIAFSGIAGIGLRFHLPIFPLITYLASEFLTLIRETQNRKTLKLYG